MRALLIATGVVAALMSPASAITVSIDFDDATVGEIIQDQYAPFGVRFELIGGTPAGPVAATYGAPIVPPGALGLGGNLMVLGLDGGAFIYDLRMTFTLPVSRVSLIVIDAEEAFGATASGGQGAEAFTVVADKTLTSASVAGSVFFVEARAPIGGPGISEFILDVTNGLGSGGGGPEAFDVLSFDPIRAPAPSPLLLLAAPLGALLFRRRSG